MKNYKVVLKLPSGYEGSSLFRTKQQARDFIKGHLRLQEHQYIKVFEISTVEKEIEFEV